MIVNPRSSRSPLSVGLAGGLLFVAGCTSTGEATTPRSTATTSTATTSPVTAPPFDAEHEAQFQAILDSADSMPPTPEATIQATVLRGSDSRSWSGASGDAGEALRPFRMASVGKTFTAAAVFRLAEDGALTLDDTIDGRLSPETVALLAGDGYQLSEITVSQLLRHTAGFYDYGFGEGSPFLNRALTDFTHVWSRAEQLQLAVDFGDPLAAPGTEFHYDDTSYVLLGEIIEQITGEPYAIAMRELLDFDGLGLNQIWLESGEQAPVDSPMLARSFFNTTELTGLDFSIDAFGGGGLAGTSLDIARFFEALLAGKVFHDPATLDLMLQIPDTNLALDEFGIPLGDGASGLYRLDIAGVVCWNHRGFLGTIAVTCPAADITVVVTTNTANTEPLNTAVALIATDVG